MPMSAKDMADHIDVVKDRLQARFNVQPPQADAQVDELFAGAPTWPGREMQSPLKPSTSRWQQQIQQQAQTLAMHAR